jgi:hypothetical protein
MNVSCVKSAAIRVTGHSVHQSVDPLDVRVIERAHLGLAGDNGARVHGQRNVDSDDLSLANSGLLQNQPIDTNRLRKVGFDLSGRMAPAPGAAGSRRREGLDVPGRLDRLTLATLFPACQ